LLDALTSESIHLCCVAIASCAKSAAILKGVVSLIYDKAVLDPKTAPSMPNYSAFEELLLRDTERSFKLQFAEIFKENMVSESGVHTLFEVLSY
ncbi:hypothetical protein V2J09_009432, partial [Rumex salicifolius]